MILVKWVIACLHACCSVMPQEVKIPGRNKEGMSVIFNLSLCCLPPSAQAPGNIVVEFKTFAAEIAKLSIPCFHFIHDVSVC